MDAAGRPLSQEWLHKWVWLPTLRRTSEQMIFKHYRRWMTGLVRVDGRRIAALYRDPASRRSAPARAPDGHPRSGVARKSARMQKMERWRRGESKTRRKPK